MKKVNENEYVWAEKYRPQTLEDVILPEEIKDTFRNYIKAGKLPNILLSSVSAGLGKTSLVNALIKDLDADVKWINGSLDAGIDLMREQVVGFSVGGGIDDSPKIVVIDEADGITDKGQKSLRGVIEEFSNVSFVFTANFKEKLIEPLRNRLTQFDFDDIYHKNKKEIMSEAYKRLMFILENEGKSYDNKQLQTIITNYAPSIREMTIVLQQFSTGKNLDLSDDVLSVSTKHINIMKNLEAKMFPAIRKSIQSLSDPASIYTYMFNNLDEWFTVESMPMVILIIAKYQDMHASARDKVIPSTAMMVELMMSANVTFAPDKVTLRK